MHSEIYEIDYRGPETHSSVPPPHHSHGKPHSKSSARAGKALGLTGATQAENKASLLFFFFDKKRKVFYMLAAWKSLNFSLYYGIENVISNLTLG